VIYHKYDYHDNMYHIHHGTVFTIFSVL